MPGFVFLYPQADDNPKNKMGAAMVIVTNHPVQSGHYCRSMYSLAILLEFWFLVCSCYLWTEAPRFLVVSSCSQFLLSNHCRGSSLFLSSHVSAVLLGPVRWVCSPKYNCLNLLPRDWYTCSFSSVVSENIGICLWLVVSAWCVHQSSTTWFLSEGVQKRWLCGQCDSMTLTWMFECWEHL